MRDESMRDESMRAESMRDEYLHECHVPGSGSSSDLGIEDVSLMLDAQIPAHNDPHKRAHNQNSNGNLHKKGTN